MSRTHRPDCLLDLYLDTLRTTNVVVVLVELVLETDYQVALCSRQLVCSARPNIGDAGNTIDRLAL